MVTAIDFAILDWIQSHLGCAALDFLMPKVTLLAEGGVLLILMSLALVAYKPRRAWGMTLIVGLTIGLVVGNLLLKNLVARNRPCWLNEGVTLLVSSPTDYSFPSGHTLHCFIAATVLCHYDRKIGSLAFVAATLVGFSRLYLYVHFPTDVVAGAMLGVAIGLLAIRIAETSKRCRRQGRPARPLGLSPARRKPATKALHPSCMQEIANLHILSRENEKTKGSRA